MVETDVHVDKENEFEKLCNVVFDPEARIGARMRSIFELRTLGTKESRQCLIEALKNKENSVLIRHELAYVLGQMQNEDACADLCDVLEDVDDDPIVRHEAAEALGAIGSATVLDILEKYLSDSYVEVRETCEIALKRVKWKIDHGKDSEPSSVYESVDPAPPLEIEKDSKSGDCEVNKLDVDELKAVLLDRQLALFKRYRAMFSLRNNGSEKAVIALAEGLNDDCALFRHEVAYVLGQMEHLAAAAVDALSATLEKKEEHMMVRKTLFRDTCCLYRYV
mmetsp:Transcript_30429/g.37618  ORF Transcript_30429/g.37618 Transcript_30429/m.37618 type:complete len:279 (+) Transcript_30429:398-1234(+)